MNSKLTTFKLNSHPSSHQSSFPPTSVLVFTLPSSQTVSPWKLLWFFPPSVAPPPFLTGSVLHQCLTPSHKCERHAFVCGSAYQCITCDQNYERHALSVPLPSLVKVAIPDLSCLICKNKALKWDHHVSQAGTFLVLSQSGAPSLCILISHIINF